MREKSLEILTTMVEYMENVIEGVNQIINNYMMGEETKANSMMIQLVDGLDWINRGLSLTKDFHNIDNSELNEMYLEICKAMENRDTVLITDLLDYEIKPIIESWKKTLKEDVL